MYTITIERDGEEILSSEIEADRVIDIFVLAEKSRKDVIDEEEDEPQPKVKRKYKKRKKEADGTDGDGTSSFEGMIKKERKQPTCSLCGKIGHRSHRCPNKDSKSLNDLDQKSLTDKEIDEAVAGGALDRTQFSQVRELKHKEMNTKEVAEELDMDEEEVRSAYQAITYEGYLALRS